MVFSILSQKQTTKFATETVDSSTTYGSSHVEITNEDNAHHSAKYQGYCSL